MLRTLQRLEVPCVEPVAVISGRTTRTARAPALLVTRHLRFSLPYRALFSQTLRPDTATRLADALALLLVQLHIIGFFWGDVSLSNTLFRRDAGAFAAYLVDAETGKLYQGGLSKGQRENDLEIARVNIAGELMDLAAGGHVDEDLDPLVTSETASSPSTGSLWNELMGRSRSPPRSAGASTSASTGSTRSASTSRSCRSAPRRAAPRSSSSRRSSTPGTTPAGCCGSPGSTPRRTRPGAC